MLISEATLTAWKPATFCGPTSPHKWGWFFLTNQMLFSVFNFSCTSQFCPHQLAESCDSKKISFIGICSTQKGGLFLKMFVGNRVWALFLQSCAAHFASNFTQLIIIIMWNWFIDDNNDDRTFNAFLAFQFQWVHGSKHFYLLRFWKDCSELNVSTLAMSWSSLPAVDTLSDSNSGADDPESASKSSSSSADVAAKPAAKRKKCALDDEVHARATLGHKCKCARVNCYEPFSETKTFEELLAFRRNWCKLHKLDQDRVVPRIVTHLFFPEFGGFEAVY